MQVCRLFCRFFERMGGGDGLWLFVRRFIRGFLGGRRGMLWVCMDMHLGGFAAVWI